ncbi:Cubilin [Nymphon striatum]|nr:Cubilin [Nymphon striatum]
MGIRDGRSCSGMVVLPIGNQFNKMFYSPNFPDHYPAEELDCRWIFELSNTNTDVMNFLKIQFYEFNLADSFDTVEIRDGNRKDGKILAYLTNTTYSPTRLIYSSGKKSLWVRFSTDSGNSGKGFKGMVNGDVLSGGFYKNSGSISLKKSEAVTGSEYVYMIQTAKNTQVQLTFDSERTELRPNSKLLIYDGFDTKLSPLLDSLVSNRQFYDVISSSNELMIISNDFGSPNYFTASFKGIPYGYHDISIEDVGIKSIDSMYLGNLSWIIRPHMVGNDRRVIVLTIDNLVLNGEDQIKICKLGNCVSPILTLDSKNLQVAKLYVDILSGIKIQIQRSYNYSSIMTVFSASYRVIQACERTFNLTKNHPVVVESPNFPSDYPLDANCRWIFNIPTQMAVHISFYHLDTLPYHIINLGTHANATIMKWSGGDLPNDLIFNATRLATVTFQTPIRKVAESATGFKFVATLIDCGSNEYHSTGVIHTPKYPKDITIPVLCIWKIKVPWIGSQGNDSHQYISFSTNLDPSESYSIHDGGSVRNVDVANVTAKEGGQSHRNMIVVVYNKTTNNTQSGVTLSYQASCMNCYNYNNLFMLACPKIRQCGNGICIHDSWVCDGIGQCPDFADEKNCNPHSSKVVKHGVAAYVTVICVLVFFMLGVVLAIVIPMIYRKHKTGSMYSSFSNIPVVADI